jgi:hypothetical protein
LAQAEEPSLHGQIMLETLSQSLCGLTLLLWVLIATLSRTDRAENIAQWVMFFIALATAASLVYLDWTGGSIWGSAYLLKPLALICVAFAFLARLNIKGQNISQGMNPHEIMKMNRLAREEE